MLVSAHDCAIQAGHIKVEVPTLVPSTAEEVLEYGLAERRRPVISVSVA